MRFLVTVGALLFAAVSAKLAPEAPKQGAPQHDPLDWQVIDRVENMRHRPSKGTRFKWDLEKMPLEVKVLYKKGGKNQGLEFGDDGMGYIGLLKVDDTRSRYLLGRCVRGMQYLGTLNACAVPDKVATITIYRKPDGLRIVCNKDGKDILNKKFSSCSDKKWQQSWKQWRKKQNYSFRNGDKVSLAYRAKAQTTSEKAKQAAFEAADVKRVAAQKACTNRGDCSVSNPCLKPGRPKSGGFWSYKTSTCTRKDWKLVKRERIGKFQSENARFTWDLEKTPLQIKVMPKLLNTTPKKYQYKLVQVNLWTSLTGRMKGGPTMNGDIGHIGILLEYPGATWYLNHCMGRIPFPKCGERGGEKVFTISRTSERVKILCNGKQMVNFELSKGCKTAGWKKTWMPAKKPVAISFATGDTASLAYRAKDDKADIAFKAKAADAAKEAADLLAPCITVQV